MDNISFPQSIRDFDTLSQHNITRPIFTLPPEILGRILEYLRDIHPMNLCWFHPQAVQAFKRPLWFYRLGWVVVTHVCRRLRQVSLSYAGLWTNITSYGICEAWLLELLKRSKDAPLSLNLRNLIVHIPYPESFVECLQDYRNISRMRIIEANDTQPQVMEFLRSLLEGPAPLLERLKVSGRGGFEDNVQLPPVCFQSYAPRLREVHLDRVSFSWSSLRGLSALTGLTICRGHLSHSANGDEETQEKIANLPSEAVVECLRRLPLLQRLHLQDALPYAPLSASRLCSSVSLPNLEWLQIEDTVTSCGWFLGSLDIPYLENMLEIHASLDNTDGEGSRAELRELLRFISSYVPRIDPAGITELQVYIEPNRVRFDTWPGLVGKNGKPIKEDVNGSYNVNESYYLSLWFDLPPSNDPGSFTRRYSLLHTVLAAYPLHNLQLLRFAVDDGAARHADFLDYNFWHRFYDMCANANAIQVREAAAVTLLPLLATRNVSGWKLANHTELRRPLFPTLEALSVGEIGTETFEDTIGRCVDLTDQAFHGLAREERHVAFLRECLASRTGHAVSLEHLYVDVNEELRWLGRDLESSLMGVAKKVDSGVYDW